MVRVDLMTTDKITAWRIRDAMACHPLLGGCTAQISIDANYEHVTLSGWTSDERLSEIALRLAQNAAGRRLISVNLNVGVQCRQSSTTIEQAVAPQLC
jgi:hypothetical protein